ncbi:deleted in malignant brain tumors 1 protein-like [Strongylocentrotus purpuratus]|uniref:SRCR domain-containing protein n=1 Tax=Strongylocentrotus purpuratus TaxID=7668 RepID=A0A7M7PJA8_STRPU|nr:deleted in malignant brain tumors 1 protein-like [Strongylocentrotus purpuratus]
MLWFDGALDAPRSARFGQGSGDILGVNCWGTEDSLLDCHTHPNPFQVCLVGGSNDAEGRVEVLNDGSWGTICDNSWELRDARVVCRMMGFNGALDAPTTASFGQGSGRILLNYVSCEGSEDNLAECAHAGIGLNPCSHTKDAGAICYSGTNPTPFDVHLIGGSNEAEGRVEVLYDGLLGTICDDSWDLRDARVVCRMLGFDGALEAPRSARFGQGSGRILLTDVICEGTEDNLADCAHRGVGDYTSCSHAKDAGVICYSGAHPQPFQVRLIGGSNDAEGRVEVTHDGSWGTICHLGWDLRDARVVCRMLGFDGALEAPRSARFDQGSGRILLKNVNCEGTEDNLADCAHGGVGDYTSCSHARDAGVICYSGAHPQPFQVRLIAGSNDAEGRVKVMHEGSWGTICHLGWDLRDARVVCRMLGFDGALEAPRSARFGQDSGRILLKDVNCEGTEGNLADCAHRGVGDYTSCGHVRDAGIICYSGAFAKFEKRSTSIKILFSSAHPQPFQVRLIGGSNNAEGRVEVTHEGSRGTICNLGWDVRDARVVCRMIGFDGALEAQGSARFGQGSGRILLFNVGCDGTEENLADCAHTEIQLNTTEPFQVRLTNGTTDSEGRVKVLYKGSWGTICDDSWDLRDARVVCKMLGFDGALAAPGSATFGAGSGKILFDDVGCKGTEDTLAECYHRGFGVNNCEHDSDAGVICFIEDPFQVRLVDGSNDAEGRVEVLHDGSWGTICDDWWDLKDARVVCRMLGFNDALAAPISARFGQGPGQSLLTYVRCKGTEDHLAACFHAGVGSSHCSHGSDAGASCSVGGKLFKFQLDNGADGYEGRVEILHEGSWGTVCDDSWDLNDAKVVCRQLGFDGALAALPQARFGQGSGDIFLDGVQCNGTETNLKDCKHKGIAMVICRMLGFDGALAAPRSARFGQGSGDVLRVICWGTEGSLADCLGVWPDSSCGHHKDVGAVCYSGDPFQVRLVGGSNSAEGRVEVLYDGSWGDICDDSWDLRDARVVCKMLGFDGALAAPGSARFGQGSGPILLTRLACKGTEDNLADCAHAGIGNYTSCGHARDAGVICYSGVRLVGGSNDAEGRVEVMHNGSWGTICDDSWDLRDARVVCRMLGFDGALDAPGSARFGQGSGDILLDDVWCSGTEENLAECPHRGVGVHNCGHNEDAGAICYLGTHPQPFQVRLVGGSNNAEGRVEVMHDGSWGTICDTWWDLRDTRVVCRMLGFDGALAAAGSARFGRGSGRILLAYVGSHPNPFQVRLFGGSNDAEGTVEVMHDGSWGTICDYSWDLRDARVVCRMLGFDGSLDAPRSARFGQGSSQILLSYVECEGTEDNLADCAHVGIERYSCIHTRDAGAICYSGAVHPSASNVRGLDNGYAAVRAGLVLRPGGYNMTSKNQGK